MPAVKDYVDLTPPLRRWLAMQDEDVLSRMEFDAGCAIYVGDAGPTHAEMVFQALIREALGAARLQKACTILEEPQA